MGSVRPHNIFGSSQLPHLDHVWELISKPTNVKTRIWGI